MQRAARLTLAAMMALLATGTGWSADATGPAPFSTDRVEHARREFGDVRFIMGSGQAMKWLEVYAAGDLVAAYRDFEAQEVHASPDGNYFLAISNKASSSMAYAVLDRRGRLIFSASHTAPTLHHCSNRGGESWRWINAEKPVARFEVERISWASPARDYLKTVRVLDCEGKDLLLGQATEPRNSAEPRPLSASARRLANLECGVQVDTGEVVVTGSRNFNCNTISNLRGLDPTFGSRTLTLIDGRRLVQPSPPLKAEEPKPDSSPTPE